MANGDFEFQLVGNTYALKAYRGSAVNVLVPSTHDGRAVTTICANAFYFLHNVKSVTLPNTVTCLEKYAFKNCGIESIVLSDSVTQVGVGAFECCSALKSVRLPKGMKRIENSTFYGCMKLENINLPESLKEIGERAFYECRSLKSLVMPSSLTLIEENAFAYCNSLTNVVFANPRGWFLTARVTDNYGDALSADELGYPPIASKLLQKQFLYGNFWKRK